jgi:putative FmdB family regulatory protein
MRCLNQRKKEKEMPIYTYRCENCGVRFDRQQKFSDPVLTTCPECNKKSLKKVITPAGVVFKGSGWYATDHRSPSGQSARSVKHEPSAESKTESPAPASSGSSEIAA